MRLRPKAHQLAASWCVFSKARTWNNIWPLILQNCWCLRTKIGPLGVFKSVCGISSKHIDTWEDVVIGFRIWDCVAELIKTKWKMLDCYLWAILSLLMHYTTKFLMMKFYQVLNIEEKNLSTLQNIWQPSSDCLALSLTWHLSLLMKVPSSCSIEVWFWNFMGPSPGKLGRPLWRPFFPPPFQELLI